MAELMQVITTSGKTLNYRPRTNFYRGNSGSVREVALPENHLRGEALTPKTWQGGYGSVRQIMNLRASALEAENHGRGGALTPATWRGTYGSVLQREVTGTFDGSEPAGLYQNSQLLSPEKLHVTPQIEAALAESTRRKTWFGGGQVPMVEGTFG